MMRKRWSVGAGLIAGVAAGALAWGSLPPAAAVRPASGAATPRAVDVERVSLRLAAAPGQVADVSGASHDDMARVIQWAWTGAPNQLWEPHEFDNGFFAFRSVNSGKCLNVRGGGHEDGAEVIQYHCDTAPNEQWRLVPAGNGYHVVSRASGKCLNVRGGLGHGNPLIQYTCQHGGLANDVWLPVWEPAAR